MRGAVESQGGASNGSTRNCNESVPDQHQLCDVARLRRLARVACAGWMCWWSRTCIRRRERPALGPFVRDQVEALRRRDDLEVELFAFGPGPRALAGAARALRTRYRGRRFDIVHAHFGLTAWPARARAARAGRRDAARQRPARAPLLPRDARGAAVHGAHRRGLARVQREPAGRGRPSAASRCCPSGSTCTASGRSRAPRRASGSGSIRPARTCCSRTTRRGR